MSKIIYAEAENIPDLKQYRSAELVFSGSAIGLCREVKGDVSVGGGSETLKRWISSASFSVIILSGFSEVVPQLKDSFVSWVSDHEAESDAPLLVVISSGPWKEGMKCTEKGEIEKYLKNIK